MAAEILLIDRDVATIERVQPVLEREGYHVGHASPGPAAIRMTMAGGLLLVVLGIDARDEDWRFCRRLLAYLEIPLILLLTGDDELDRARGLELGADDCLPKTVAMVELVARVHAALRWSRATNARRPHSFFVDGDLVVDLTRAEVRLGDEPVALTPTEFQVLAHLIRHAGEALPAEWLAQQVWGASLQNGSSSIKQHIYNLRQKLEPNPGRPQRLVTRWGQGYLLQVGAGEG